MFFRCDSISWSAELSLLTHRDFLKYLIPQLKLGNWEIGRFGDLEIGRLGDREIGRLGDWEIGRVGEWKIGRLGD